MNSRTIDLLVIHASATPNGRWITAADLDAIHQRRGWVRAAAARQRLNPQFEAIGYHFIIHPNGAIATGRHADEEGAHAAPHGANRRSLGLCLIGTDRYSPAQWRELAAQVLFLCDRHRIPRRFAHAGNGHTGVCGHRDLDAKTPCPGFDVAGWLKAGMTAAADHLLETGARSVA